MQQLLSNRWAQSGEPICQLDIKR